MGRRITRLATNPGPASEELVWSTGVIDQRHHWLRLHRIILIIGIAIIVAPSSKLFIIIITIGIVIVVAPGSVPGCSVFVDLSVKHKLVWSGLFADIFKPWFSLIGVLVSLIVVKIWRSGSFIKFDDDDGS